MLAEGSYYVNRLRYESACVVGDDDGDSVSRKFCA